jgi:hypothetical protein
LSLEQYDFSFSLELLTDTHVGAGPEGLRPLHELRSGQLVDQARKQYQERTGLDGSPPIATIVRGRNDAPCIPYSGLKGALRRISDPRSHRALFGIEPNKAQGEQGQQGKLFVWAGFPTGSLAEPPDTMPFWDQDKLTFILPHIGSDPRRGTVAEGLLFNAEYLPAGLSFSFEGVFCGRYSEVEAALVPLFNRMAHPDGFEIGAEKTKSHGRVRLTNEQITLHKQVYASDPPRVEESEIGITIAPTVGKSPRRIMLDIQCEGPFLIGDPLRRTGDDAPDMSYLARRDNRPELTGEAIKHHLRRRSAWLERTTDWESRGEADKRDRKLNPGESPGALTSTQRLFGVNGWAGLIAVERIELIDGPSDQPTLPGVMINDFTQGVISGALFEDEVAVDTRYVVTLGMRDRTWKGRDSEETYPNDTDEKLFRRLASDLADNGLVLGRGEGHGFGWFACTGIGHSASEVADKEA